MNDDPVFIDTGAPIALCHRRNQLHDRAREVLRQLAAARTSFVTSQWVLTEFLGSAATGELRRAAIADTRRLLVSDRTEIVGASETGWRAAFELYESRLDKDWSLVDCSSILICQAREIRRVFTHDHHFEQAGFQRLL
ncbi:MAG: PIN domain-containing protein [Acidobacteria bacterium]|nr:PIN domain-containing protein [Acidobacteriota bacterium]